MNSCCVNKKYGYPGACDEGTCMNLPKGKTCGDCVFIRKCLALGFTSGEGNISCDFFPQRFQEKI